MAGGAGQAEGLVLINTLRKDSPRLNWVNDAVVRVFETGGGDLLKDLYSPLLMNEDWHLDHNRSLFHHTGKSEPIDAHVKWDCGHFIVKPHQGPVALPILPIFHVCSPFFTEALVYERAELGDWTANALSS